MGLPAGGLAGRWRQRDLVLREGLEGMVLGLHDWGPWDGGIGGIGRHIRDGHVDIEPVVHQELWISILNNRRGATNDVVVVEHRHGGIQALLLVEVVSIRVTDGHRVVRFVDIWHIDVWRPMVGGDGRGGECERRHRKCQIRLCRGGVKAVAKWRTKRGGRDNIGEKGALYIPPDVLR